MKVLQTLGKHGGQQEGVFQYRRDSRGVYIEPFLETQAPIHVPNDQWSSILTELEANTTFRLTRSDSDGPSSLYDLIQKNAPSAVSDSHRSYVAAILEHEGSIDLYHGRIRGGSAFIALISDINSPSGDEEEEE